MKPKFLLLPLALLVIGIWWPGLRAGRDKAGVSQDAASHSPPAPGGEHRGEVPAKATRARERPAGVQAELKKLLSWQASVRGKGGIDLKALRELQGKLDGMSVEDLLAILDEMDSAGPGEQTTGQLELYIADALSRHEPQLGLDRFAHRITDKPGAMAFQLARIFQSWAGTDATAAAAWLDRQIAEGRFTTERPNGKNENLTRFETALLKPLAASNPAAAGERLAALSDNERAAILRQDWFSQMKSGKDAAIADFIRSQTPEQDRAATLAAAAASRVHHGSYEGVSGFLTAIEANAGERAAVAGEAVKGRIVGQPELKTNIEEARAWFVEQAPEDAERLTGVALAQLVEWHDFAEMAKLALRYHESSGSDDALVAFLTNAPEASRMEILALANKINDPAAREEVTRRFINNPKRAADPVEPPR